MKSALKNAARCGWLAMTAATFLVAGAYGCSSSSSAAGDDSSSGGDGGAGDGATGSDGSTSNNPYTGVVNVSQDLTSGPSYVSSLSAYFIKKQTAASGCTTTVSGPCTLIDCTAVVVPDGGGAPATYVSAGAISITGGKLPAQGKSLPYAKTNGVNQYFVQQSTQIFAPGDTFNVTAAGQDVAAFTGTSLAAPADITLTAPLPVTSFSASQWTINEAQDLAVTWTGGSARAETKVIMENDSDAVELVCVFDATAGTGTVPTTLMTKLGPNDGSSSGVGGVSTFSVTPEAKTTLSVSNADVAFTVTGTKYYGSFKTQ